MQILNVFLPSKKKKKSNLYEKSEIPLQENQRSDQHFSVVLTLSSAVMVIGNAEELLFHNGVWSGVAVIMVLRSGCLLDDGEDEGAEMQRRRGRNAGTKGEREP